MRFRLRTLLIVLAVGPVVLAVAIAQGISLLQKHRHAIVLESVYTAEEMLEGRHYPDTPILSLPPSN